MSRNKKFSKIQKEGMNIYIIFYRIVTIGPNIQSVGRRSIAIFGLDMIEKYLLSHFKNILTINVT